VLNSVLVANRGEIARRILATARRLGVRTVAVYSEADAGLPFVAEADEAVPIGPPPPAQSYLDSAAVLAAAHHPDAGPACASGPGMADDVNIARGIHRDGLRLGRSPAE